MRLIIGSDHGGYHLKEFLKGILEETGHEYEDIGVFNGDESADYPLLARKVAREVAAGKYDRGIVLCGTGIGVSIVANKVRGIRAALCHDTFSARASREHNDANVLAMGGRVIGFGPAGDVLKVWLETGFSGADRHARRVRQMEES